MKTLCFAFACLLLGVLGVGVVEAQTEPDTVTSDEISRALDKPVTRGLRVRTKSKVDLNIPFEINSSDLKPEAVKQLVQLEEALKMEQLSNFRFAIVGHTDASGSAAYNRNLSRARAESVTQFLIDRGVDPERLDVIGKGEDELLHPDQPLHGANRRVEIRNLGEQ